MKIKIITITILLPILFLFIFFIIGSFLYYYCNNNIQEISRILTDYMATIGLTISMVWILLSSIKDSGEYGFILNGLKLVLDLLLNRITIINLNIINISTMSGTLFMYFLHDIYHFSTVNNYVCDAGWNVITLLWALCIVVNHGYRRKLIYSIKNNER